MTKNAPATTPPKVPFSRHLHRLCLGAGQKHAEVERPQVLALGDPALLLDQFSMHDRDLARRPTEVDEPELHPEPESLPEANRLGLSLHLLRGLRCHLHLLHLMTRQFKTGGSVTTVTLRCQGSERRGTRPILTISRNCGYSAGVLRHRREHGREQTSST